VEGLITPAGSPAAKLADIEMLVMNGSRDRTEEELAGCSRARVFGWIALCSCENSRDGKRRAKARLKPAEQGLKPGRRQMAARADCGRTLARSQDDFAALLVGTETGVLIDKASKMVAAVQNRGQFHGAKASNGETSTISRLRTWV
jgi:hypothetical protein